MRLISFGSVIFPQANGVQNLPVPFRSAVVPLRGGGFDQDGVNSYLDSKVVNASFWVSSQDVADIDAFINSLYTEASKGRRLLVAKMRDNTTEWQAEAKLVNASSSPDSRYYGTADIADVEGYERMQCAFEIPYPYWLNIEDVGRFLDEGWYMDSGVTLDSGQSTEVTTSSTVNTFTIDNNGGAAHDNSELTIEALTGATVTDVLVENLTTGEELAWTGTLTAGQQLVIQTLPQTIRKNGTDDYSNTVLPSGQIGFWKLALGENEFQITFTSVSGGDAQISYKWARQYIR